MCERGVEGGDSWRVCRQAGTPLATRDGSTSWLGPRRKLPAPCLAAQWPPSSHLRSLAVPVPPLPPPHCKTEPRPCVAGREYPCGPPAPPAHLQAEGAPARPASNSDLHRLQLQVSESQRGGEGCSSAQGEHQQPSARLHRRRASRTAGGSGGLSAVQAAVRERGGKCPGGAAPAQDALAARAAGRRLPGRHRQQRGVEAHPPARAGVWGQCKGGNEGKGGAGRG